MLLPPLPKDKPTGWTDATWRWRTGTDKKIGICEYVWVYIIKRMFK